MKELAREKLIYSWGCAIRKRVYSNRDRDCTKKKGFNRYKKGVEDAVVYKKEVGDNVGLTAINAKAKVC